jgi:transcriptional regulator with XRE-family HTH domain
MSQRSPSAEYFGRALAAARAERGFKRMQLKERSGLSYPYISELENGGKYPSQRAIEALAGALDLAPIELLNRAAELEQSDQPSNAGLVSQAAREVAGRNRADQRSLRDLRAAELDSESLDDPVGHWQSLRGRTTEGLSDADDLVERLSEQIFRSVQHRLQGWLDIEIRMAVRDELDRLRESR